MFRSWRSAISALQLQYVSHWMQQLRVTAADARHSANRLSTSAVSFEQPASALAYTEEQIAQIRHRIFGTHIGNGLPSGRKLLQKKLIGEKVASYYEHGEPMKDPMIVSLKAERRAVQLAALKRRGKGPPKKGQGKRAGKKKK